MNFTMGLDPDLHCCGVAIYNFETRKIVTARTIEIPRKFKGVDAVREMLQALDVFFGKDFWGIANLTDQCLAYAVETQQIYPGKSKARPNDLLKLALVSGGALLAGMFPLPVGKIFLPAPRQWKGNVPKPIHQARLCERLGWRYKKTQGYTYPLNSGITLRPSQWKQAMDGVGLALWAADQVAKTSRKF